MQSRAFRLVSWLFLCPLAAVPACGATDGAQTTAELGTLSLPLVTSVNGHAYRLSGSLLVQGSYLSWVELGGEAEVLSVPLGTGAYVAQLYAWQLSRDDGSGGFVSVPAALVSAYQVPFQIYESATSTITFTFETDGVLVRVGAGELDVRVEVQELPPVCEPFGRECGDGLWCPSSELTGAARACVAAGATAIGSPCSGPLDCVADSSCFDFGTGPVCTALCPASWFGQPCSRGGDCIPDGSDYGICTPMQSEP